MLVLVLVLNYYWYWYWWLYAEDVESYCTALHLVNQVYDISGFILALHWIGISIGIIDIDIGICIES